MADLAKLGLQIESKPVEKAGKELVKFKKSAKGASSANDNLSKSSKKASTATDKHTRSTDKLVRSQKKATGALANVSKVLVRQAVKIGAVITAVLTLEKIITSAASAYLIFNKALAETSTLIEGTPEQMAFLATSARDMAKEFGSSATSQVNAFYQAISAGASSVQDAAATLRVANQLAVGGVTTIETAVDGLTSVLNAYGDAIPSAIAASDAMFVGMKAGKTTIGELSGALGTVAPFAVQVGVSFDELVGSIAALTKGGVNTKVAVTGVRAILAAVVKPTKDAADEAKRLGLEFTATALQSKGFAGFLTDVSEKTGGSVTSISKLFGGVEALVPVLAFAGQAGKDFNNIMDDMSEKSGATSEAFDKVAGSLSFRLNKELGRLSDNLLPIGEFLIEVIVPALEAFNDWMERSGKTVSAVSAVMQADITALANITAETFKTIPQRVAESTIEAMNFMIEFISKGLNKIRQDANDVIKDVNSFFKTSIKEFELSDPKQGTFKNPYEGANRGLKEYIDLQNELAQNVRNRLTIGFQDDAGGNGFGIPANDNKPAGGGTSEDGDAGGGIKAATHAWEGLTKAVKQTRDAVQFTRDVTGGFVSDLRSGLKQGESFWNSFKSAALNAVDKITDKLINELLDALFKVRKTGGSIFGFSGGGGSSFGAFTNPANTAPIQFAAPTFASGGYTGDGAVDKFAGVTHGQEFVVNASATRANRGMLEAMNSGRNISAGGNVIQAEFRINTTIDERGNIDAFVRSGANQQIQEASPKIIEAAVDGSGSAIANGQFKQPLAEYNLTRKTKAR